MALTWPTKAQIFASIVTLWKGERPDADSTKYSDLWLFSKVASVLVYRLHRTIKQALDAVFPNTSFGVYLDNWLILYGLEDGQGSFGRILPHISSNTDGLTCTATGGGPGVLANAWKNKTLTDSAGKSYIISDNHGAVGAGSSIDLDCLSVDTGYATNLESGTVLTFDSPPAGSDSTATLSKDLVGGKDLGEDSDERARLLKRIRNPPASGNVADWVAVIEAVSPGNLTAYVWPQRQNYSSGYCTTDYCALYTNESGTDRHIAAADDIYTDIGDAIEDNLPALSWLQSRQLTMSSVSVDVDVTVELGLDATEDQKCDWDAEGNKTTVSSTVYATKTINASGNMTDVSVTNGASVGDRVVINGYEAVVATTPLATQFTVEEWPDGWPTGAAAMNGLNITSGGGFIGYKTDYDNSITGTGLVEAIRAYMDGRGPNVSYAGAQSEIPGWDSTARIQQIESTCFVIGGGAIVDVTVDDLGGGVVDLAHASESGATVLIYDVDEITVWQVYV